MFTGLLRIGITGSTGKTTTKEIAGAIIAQERKVVMNKGNLNSETGLPLSVFDVRSDHEVGIFEAGMNRQGEIAELARVLNPELALITNIGSAHIGILGSRDKIAEEKKQIFSEFTGSNIALIPAEDDYRDFLARDVRGRKVFYGPSSLSALGAVRDLGLEGTEIIWDNKALRFALPGTFNLRNALAAAAMAQELSISNDSIRLGLQSVKPLFGRGEILYGRTTVIRDCYNSNPESSAAALDFCDGLQWPGRRIYVMGSMLELGDLSEEAHAALGRQLASCRAEKLFLFGEEMGPAAEELANYSRNNSWNYSAESGKNHCARQFFYTTKKDELSKALEDYIKEGDLVLLKGSRGCALEELTELLLGNTKQRSSKKGEKVNAT